MDDPLSDRRVLQPSPDETLWFVAHTRPRCEKKLVSYCEQEDVSTTLPLYRTMHKYRGKKVEFKKPLFPGYVFLRMPTTKRQTVFQSKYVANLLEVHDQAEFDRQLADILVAVETELDIQLAPEIGEGRRVVIKSGPLRGMEGWVEKRFGMSTVLLRLDFISQAAAVKVEADHLELA